MDKNIPDPPDKKPNRSPSDDSEDDESKDESVSKVETETSKETVSKLVSDMSLIKKIDETKTPASPSSPVAETVPEKKSPSDKGESQKSQRPSQDIRSDRSEPGVWCGSTGSSSNIRPLETNAQQVDVMPSFQQMGYFTPGPRTAYLQVVPIPNIGTATNAQSANCQTEPAIILAPQMRRSSDQYVPCGGYPPVNAQEPQYVWRNENPIQGIAFALAPAGYENVQRPGNQFPVPFEEPMQRNMVRPNQAPQRKPVNPYPPQTYQPPNYPPQGYYQDLGYNATIALVPLDERMPVFQPETQMRPIYERNGGGTLPPQNSRNQRPGPSREIEENPYQPCDSYLPSDQALYQKRGFESVPFTEQERPMTSYIVKERSRDNLTDNRYAYGYQNDPRFKNYPPKKPPPQGKYPYGNENRKPDSRGGRVPLNNNERQNSGPIQYYASVEQQCTSTDVPYGTRMGCADDVVRNYTPQPSVPKTPLDNRPGWQSGLRRTSGNGGCGGGSARLTPKTNVPKNPPPRIQQAVYDLKQDLYPGPCYDPREKQNEIPSRANQRQCNSASSQPSPILYRGVEYEGYFRNVSDQPFQNGQRKNMGPPDRLTLMPERLVNDGSMRQMCGPQNDQPMNPCPAGRRYYGIFDENENNQDTRMRRCTDDSKTPRQNSRSPVKNNRNPQSRN